MLFRSIVALALIGMSFGHVLRFENRIVGGRNATIEQRPWHASINFQFIEQNSTSWVYSGSGAILGPQLIVTVADAVTNQNGTLLEGPFFVRAGSARADDGGVFVAVERIVVHAEFNKTTAENNVALLFLAAPLNFNESISAIALPAADAESLPEGTNVSLSGWTINESPEDDLQVVDQVIRSLEVCQQAYEGVTDLVGENNICAATEEENVGPCSVSRYI